MSYVSALSAATAGPGETLAAKLAAGSGNVTSEERAWLTAQPCPPSTEAERFARWGVPAPAGGNRTVAAWKQKLCDIDWYRAPEQCPPDAVLKARAPVPGRPEPRTSEELRADTCLTRRATDAESRRTNTGALLGALVGAGTVLAGGAWVGSAVAGPKSRTAGAVVGAVVVSIPAVVAGMVGSWIGYYLFGGRGS